MDAVVLFGHPENMGVQSGEFKLKNRFELGAQDEAFTLGWHLISRVSCSPFFIMPGS